MTLEEAGSITADVEEASAVSFGHGKAQKTKYRGIVVLGSNPLSRAQAPFSDKEWLIYCCSPDNSPHGFSPDAAPPPRVDVSFEIHDPVFDRTRPYAYLDWLRNVPKVYMRDRVAMNFRDLEGNPLFPNALAYPDEELRGKKQITPDGKVLYEPGIFHRSQFRSSIAFIMAKAIVDIEAMRKTGEIEGNGEIALYGILQQAKNEYSYQRQSTQYFLEEAARRGIKTYVAAESLLFHDEPEIF